MQEREVRRPLGDPPPSGGVWVSDENDAIVYASPGLVELTGVPLERILGASVVDGFSAETLAEFAPFYESAKSTGQPVYYDRIRVTTPGGRSTFQSGWLIPMMADGRVHGMTCTISDVTFTYEAELELLASRDRWRTLLSLAPVGVYETDGDGKCLFVNQKWCELAGVECESAKTDGWAAVVHPDDRRCVVDAWQGFIEGGPAFDQEYRLCRPDGQVVWVHGIGASVTPQTGDIRRHLGVLVDITASKTARDELERERARAEGYLDAADMILVALDREGTVVRANALARDTLGTAEYPLVGSNWLTRYVADSDRASVQAVFEQLRSASSAQVDIHENPIVLPDGEMRIIQWHNSVVRDPVGDIQEMLGLGVDVTELRAAEAVRQESEAKDRFLANMSHELRTPLNSILGFSDVLLSGLAEPLTAEQAKQVSIIHEAGHYLLALVDDLLDVEQVVSGTASLNMHTTSCSELTASVIEQMRPEVESGGLELRFTFCKTPIAIVTDTRRVKQIILNLIANALKFTPSGTITVDVACTPERVQVSVADTGVGIPIDELDRIFELYHQVPRTDVAKSLGAGIGLSLSRSYARLLGGDLTVTSQLGVGSVFTLTLPVTHHHE